MDNKVLLIIPAYNEELNIQKTVEDVKKYTNYDYIIINDSSKDKTKKVCEKNNYNIINLPINGGLTSGIQLGLKYAWSNNYDIAIQFDGDGQHKAECVEKLVETIRQEKANIVIGSRFITEKKSKSLRMIGSILLTLSILLTTRKKIKDPTSGMRAFDKKIIEEFVINESLTPEPDTLVYMLKKGYTIKEVAVEMKEREFGTSYLNSFKAIEYMGNMFFSIFFVRLLTRNRKGKKTHATVEKNIEKY